MTTTTRSSFFHLIASLRHTYPHLHIFYSKEDRWAYLSFKGQRERIDSGMSAEEIKEIINLLK